MKPTMGCTALCAGSDRSFYFVDPNDRVRVDMTDALTEGDRVVTLQTNGDPAGSIGTVTAYRDFEEPYALVDIDGYPGDILRIPRHQLKRVGCETCKQTGIVAERREGNLYRTACPDCFPEGKRLGYWTDAEEYHVRYVV